MTQAPMPASANKLRLAGGLAAIFSILMLTLFVYGFHNQEVSLRASYQAKTDANKADFDAMWKIIKQTAQVPAQYKNDFQDVYGEIMDARYQQKEGDGTLMRWIHEQNPNFDSSLYAKIQTAVEAQRTKFATRQKELRDVKREHDQLLRQMPGALYNAFMGRAELDVVLVTSDKTEEAFSTGSDNDVELFQKP